MTDAYHVTNRRTVGLRDIPLALLAPKRVFARVEDVNAWVWPLIVLLVFVTLIGCAIVQTGLIDRQVDRQVRAEIAQLDSVQRDVVERSALREMYREKIEMGEFFKLLTRLRVIVAEPAKTLAAVLLLAALFYGLVALGGRKPEWNTLLTICVFAAFTDALRLLMTLILMIHERSLAVHTSLAPLAEYFARQYEWPTQTLAITSGLLSALDPFRFWFWMIVLIGLSATAQLKGWRAWTICILCWLIASGARMAVILSTLTQSATNGS